MQMQILLQSQLHWNLRLGQRLSIISICMRYSELQILLADTIAQLADTSGYVLPFNALNGASK